MLERAGRSGSELHGASASQGLPGLLLVLAEGSAIEWGLWLSDQCFTTCVKHLLS